MTEKEKDLELTLKGNQAKKKPVEKHCLSSPYFSEWPSLEKGENKNILEELKNSLSCYVCKKKNKPLDEEDKNLMEKSVKIKQSMVFGINQVTKALEKDILNLILVCKSTKQILTKHLMILSTSRAVPACGLYGLNEVLCPIFGIKSIAACGFKRKLATEFLEDLVLYITCKTPPLSSSLNIWKFNDGNKEPKETSRSNVRYQPYNMNIPKSTFIKTKVKTIQPSGKKQEKKETKT